MMDEKPQSFEERDTLRYTMILAVLLGGCQSEGAQQFIQRQLQT